MHTNWDTYLPPSKEKNKPTANHLGTPYPTSGIAAVAARTSTAHPVSGATSTVSGATFSSAAGHASTAHPVSKTTSTDTAVPARGLRPRGSLSNTGPPHGRRCRREGESCHRAGGRRLGGDALGRREKEAIPTPASEVAGLRPGLVKPPADLIVSWQPVLRHSATKPAALPLIVEKPVSEVVSLPPSGSVDVDFEFSDPADLADGTIEQVGKSLGADFDPPSIHPSNIQERAAQPAINNNGAPRRKTDGSGLRPSLHELSPPVSELRSVTPSEPEPSSSPTCSKEIFTASAPPSPAPIASRRPHAVKSSRSSNAAREAIPAGSAPPSIQGPAPAPQRTEDAPRTLAPSPP
ncbi:hypothetical protein BDK51DRAFT_39992, partial [Blyttiomyces helicus]